MHPDIIIVGAGPTGLTLACELYRRGVACRVIERSHARSRDSRATDIHARTLELFRALGIDQRIVERGKKVRRFRAYSSGRLIADLSLDLLSSQHPYAIALPQLDTETILEERLNELGGAVERGVRLTALEELDGRARVTLERVGGSQERVSCAWLIGCDGVHSTVRRAGRIAFRGITYREQYLVVDADLEWSLAHDHVHLFSDRGGFINVLALPENDTRVRILANLPGRRHASLIDAMSELFAERARVPARIERPTFASTFRISKRLAARYRKGSVILVGDAAHTCSPLLGQGMNVGIQDAFNLGWKLAQVARGQAKPALLDSYEAERRPIGRTVLAHTHLLHQISTMSNPLLARARDACTAYLQDLSGVRRLAAYTCSELATHYHGSPIVTHAGAPWRAPWSRPSSLHMRGLASTPDVMPIPGDRAPDLPLCGESERRLADLFGPEHTLLAFHGADGRDAGGDREFQALVDEVTARYGEMVAVWHIRATSATNRRAAIDDRTVCDCSALLHRGFHAQRQTLCLIRPDGHIGFRADGAQAPRVLRYLDALYGAGRVPWSRADQSA